MVRKVSFSRTEGDESNRDSSVGHADDERVDGGKEAGEALKGPKMLTRRASQNLQNSSSLRALRSRTKNKKDASLDIEVDGKHKQKGGKQTSAMEEGNDTVEMEDTSSSTDQDSDGMYVSERNGSRADRMLGRSNAAVENGQWTGDLTNAAAVVYAHSASATPEFALISLIQ